MRNIIKDKRGAVNTYRFLAMYIMIGVLCGMLTAFVNNHSAESLYGTGDDQTLKEVVATHEQILNEADSKVKASQWALTTAYGDEVAQGRNIVQILRNGFMPVGIIPRVGVYGVPLYEVTDFENKIDWMLIFFRWIITIFAAYEIFQIIIKPKTT